jgi:ribosomal protein S18 acetylase RimI-like enzyme
MGHPQAYLTTQLSNIRALRLFRKPGFQTTRSYGDEVEARLDLSTFARDHPQAA